MRDNTTDFWVYEDRIVRVGHVHHGWCDSCNHGAGQFGGSAAGNGGWRALSVAGNGKVGAGRA